MILKDDLGIILVVVGFFVLLYGTISYGGQIFGKLTGKQESVFVGPIAAGDDTALANRLLLGLGTPRITPKRIVTVTGTISGCDPHFAPDGDLVFGLMPDAQFKNLLTPQNATHKCSGGGLWCEGMCQQEIKPLAASQPWHKGDCLKGGPFPKFPTPKVGDRYSVTGMYAIDHREGGFAEIHPITRMSKI